MPSPGMPFPIHPDLPDPLGDNPRTPGDESSTPQPDPAESTSGTEPRLFAGKYKSVDELEAAYNNSFRELDRIREDTRAQLDIERRRVDALYAQRAPQQVEKDPLEELTTFGVPPELIRNAIRAEATRIARDEIGQAIAPQLAAQAARASVAKTYPDFAKREEQVADFIRADHSLTERYSRLFHDDPQAAMEWAYLRFRETNPAKAPRESAADDPVDGSIPGARSTGERRPAEDRTQAEELKRAQQYYEVYKDPMPYVRARLKGLIPDSHFATR